MASQNAYMPSVATHISGINPPFQDSELVLGLVAPVGTNFEKFHHLLTRRLAQYGYTVNPVKLSALADNFQAKTPDPPAGATSEARRVNRLMHAGNFLRFESRLGEFLALAAAADIRARRKDDEVLLKTAHVVRSLKHPDEVRALRRIYGGGFFLVGVTVNEKQRREYLCDDKGCRPDEVDELLRRDEHEEDLRYVDEEGRNYGQRTRDTFQLADVFIPLDAEERLDRFLKLVFGCPFETPTPEEYAMYLAFGAALRSGDLSRQVGAVVVSENGDLVSVGANDVARAGGGLYWPGKSDERDFVRNEDSNEAQRDAILQDVLMRLRPAGQDEAAWLKEGRKLLKSSPLMDITEYGRATHAEMEALLSCARNGIPTRNATLFSTTFPCHNCAKHIIASGVRRVVYVEPYPKSQATRLFSDSIRLAGDSEGTHRVLFEPFFGIGPRRFLDLFSVGLSSGTSAVRKKGGAVIPWSPEKGVVRVPCLPNSYLDREKLAERELSARTTPPREPR